MKKYSCIYILEEEMINYNKYEHQHTKHVSWNQGINHTRARSKKKIKLTKENKAFLKAIGLLK